MTERDDNGKSVLPITEFRIGDTVVQVQAGEPVFELREAYLLAQRYSEENPGLSGSGPAKTKKRKR